MAPVPKKKHTRARSNQRRNSPSRRKVVLPDLVVCASCGKLKVSHKACPSCGSYK